MSQADHTHGAAPLLQADHLVKRFGAFTALHDVSLHLAAGEVVGFLGPNGAGKTTTMRILAGDLAPTAGTVLVAGHDRAADPIACRSRIGYLPQELPLYGDMRVEAYLDHVARLKGITRSERRRQVLRVMEQAAVEPVRRRHIAKLSGGNRQRVGLAQALLGDPPLLILDEPTAGLDPAQVANFRELIRTLARHHAILLSTHILGEVEACCDRVVVMADGRSVLDEPIAALRARAHQVSRLRLRLDDDDPARLAAILSDTPWIRAIHVHDDDLLVDIDQDERHRLLPFVLDHARVAELHRERRSLEEVFRDLVAGDAPPKDRVAIASPTSS